MPVINPPPNFVFSQTAAVLVSIDGQPVWSKMPKTPLERCMNTRALILREKNNLYVHLFDGYMEAENLSGPWTVAKKAPRDADKVAQELASQKVVDLMTGPANQKDQNQKPSLKTGAPVVYVETVPTELIVIEGAPDWVPITGTNLLYVNNSTANIVQDLDDQQTYVLVTGRWFRGPGFTGPWQYVSGKDLPPDFAKIPDDSPKENMKASVPGTPQAQEAIIAAGIPQTATVNRAGVNFTPQISGSPELNPIPNTTLNYVFNAADPIIEVSPTRVVRRPQRCVVQRHLGPGAMACSEFGSRGHLFHSSQLTALLRDLREGLRQYASSRGGWLYPWIHGHGGVC